jgi:hypothetical protein
MSPPCSCAICGLPVKKGKEIEYHRHRNHEDSGYAYIHDECEEKMNAYMTGMCMTKDNVVTVEWSAEKGGYING